MLTWGLMAVFAAGTTFLARTRYGRVASYSVGFVATFALGAVSLLLLGTFLGLRMSDPDCSWIIQTGVAAALIGPGAGLLCRRAATL
ncbi:hypothetical protein ABEG18_06240 [Alsobacter sp. KACC 23698]|uniref:GlsB/YeaQ/YmgE family stress response membrane protein n=1 Tax=Alsobacter sp. KACC 23698 TaxID=3149229 RepID=A0AAU7JJ10_9HYPH